MANESFSDKLKHAWNLFRNDDNFDVFSIPSTYNPGMSSTSRLDRKRLYPSTERSVVANVYSRIAIDVASIDVKHVRVDENDIFRENIKSDLNDCLIRSTNIDQTPREFIMDVVLSMFDEGVVAIVPIDTTRSIVDSESYDIQSMRTGRITQWYPRDVKIDVYNDREGLRKEIILPKNRVCIIENPLYNVMNERNSTLQRLLRKMSLLDRADDENSISKLDLIVQLPYVVKSPERKKQALQRKADLEEQLTNSKLGIGYIDGTEKVTQLNRSVENNLPKEVADLQSQLYNQLGLTQSVFDGTADEATMLNYQNRTIKPILESITEEMTRKFITKTGYTQGQRIKFFSNPFSLVPVSQMAEIADKFTRNEVLAPNEVRSIVGYKPSDDPRANELRNRNLNVSDEQMSNPVMADSSEEA